MIDIGGRLTTGSFATPDAADDMAWVEPAYSREDINAAGKLFVKWWTADDPSLISEDQESFDAALDVINNWRSSHSYPLLALRMNLTKVSEKIDGNALVAQRIKRLFSIAHKLERFPSMKLSQMQDLGGCRSILRGVGSVRRVVDFFLNESEMKHERASVDDYITNPKASGYRGVHLVYRYTSDNKSKRVFNGLKIEMQLRSGYQHAWATAVETVGTFSGQALKSSLGSDDWQRFFVLMGSVIALREKTALVPDTPAIRQDLLAELASYTKRLKVVERLKGYREAVNAMSAHTGARAEYFLLQLDARTGQLTVEGFDNFLNASARYEDAEKRVRENPGTDAVLVSVDSIAALGRAYPNYFADTRVFLQLLNQALTGHARGITYPAVAIGTLKADVGAVATSTATLTANGAAPVIANGGKPSAKEASKLRQD